MRFHVKGTLVLIILHCSTALPVALAQQERGRSKEVCRVSGGYAGLERKPAELRPLTVAESLAILGAALDSRHHAEFPSDCSHFVHELYESAGFPYEYASSSDLYTGIGEFRRVVSPQPGDLAVWHGHVGMVINPVQHTFFGLLHSGPGVDSYESTYWKQRGRPRFFRYVTAAPSGELSSSAQTARLKPTVLADREPNGPPDEDAGPDESPQSASRIRTSDKRVENQPANATVTRILLTNSARPNRDRLSAAFLQACTEQDLRGHDPFGSARSLIVFDHFEVKKVHVAGNQGWAEVEIDELISLRESKAEVHKHAERQKWFLTRRDDASWELIPSQGAIYLPQPAAIRILAHELARLTEATPEISTKGPDKAELARVLDVLLKK
jgi:hypothetical protein